MLWEKPYLILTIVSTQSTARYSKLVAILLPSHEACRQPLQAHPVMNINLSLKLILYTLPRHYTDSELYSAVSAHSVFLADRSKLSKKRQHHPEFSIRFRLKRSPVVVCATSNLNTLMTDVVQVA